LHKLFIKDVGENYAEGLAFYVSITSILLELGKKRFYTDE